MGNCAGGEGEEDAKDGEGREDHVNQTSKGTPENSPEREGDSINIPRSLRYNLHPMVPKDPEESGVRE